MRHDCSKCSLPPQGKSRCWRNCIVSFNIYKHFVKWRNNTQRYLEDQSWRKGLGFNLCIAPPHNRLVPNFQVMEFTEVFRSSRRCSGVHGGVPEFTEVFRSSRRYSGVHWRRWKRLEVCADGCTMVDIRTGPIIHDLFIYAWECMYLWKSKIIRRLLLLYVEYSIWLYISKMVKRRIILFVFFVPGDATAVPDWEIWALACCISAKRGGKMIWWWGWRAAGNDGRQICLSSQWGYEV